MRSVIADIVVLFPTCLGGRASTIGSESNININHGSIGVTTPSLTGCAMRTTAAFLLALLVWAGPAYASTINTQIPPFTQVGGATVQSNLTPQTSTVFGTGSGAHNEFGLATLDPTTLLTNTGTTSAFEASTWSLYPTASAEAISTNGTLGVNAEVTMSSFPGNLLQANASAFFQDALTVTLPGAPSGTLGYLDLVVSVDGNLSCDIASGICDIGFLAGYGPGTLGSTTAVDYFGGEAPESGRVSTVQQLVPLPFFSGQPFDIDLSMITTARIAKAGQFAGTFDTSNWFSTMQVTGIGVTDANGSPVNFSIASQSGLLYGPTGISAVPEPSTYATMLVALLTVFIWVEFVRARDRSRVPPLEPHRRPRNGTHSRNLLLT